MSCSPRLPRQRGPRPGGSWAGLDWSGQPGTIQKQRAAAAAAAAAVVQLSRRVEDTQWNGVCVCVCVLTGSLAVGQGFVLRHEERFGSLLPGAALSRDQPRALGPRLRGGGGRHGATGKAHHQGVAREGRGSGTFAKTEALTGRVRRCMKGCGGARRTCGRGPVLPHSVGQGGASVAVALRVNRGHRGRSLPP